MRCIIVNLTHQKPEPIIIFKGTSDLELIEFVKLIVKENGDVDYSILGVSDAVEYIDDHCDNLRLYDEEVFWGELGDIPIDENDCIDDDFIIFDKGTDVQDIWHWFEEFYDTQIGGKYI